jgi:hypothetical protein
LLSAVGYLTQRADLQVPSCSCKQYNYHNFILLYGWILHHCVYIPYFLYVFIFCSAPRLIPELAYYELCCNKHGCAGVSFLGWLTFLYFTSMPKSGIAGSEGRSNFSVSMKLHTDSHSSCTCLLTHQHWIWFPFVPYLGQVFLLIFFLNTAILTRIRENPSVVMMCTFVWLSILNIS